MDVKLVINKHKDGNKVIKLLGTSAEGYIVDRQSSSSVPSSCAKNDYLVPCYVFAPEKVAFPGKKTTFPLFITPLTFASIMTPLRFEHLKGNVVIIPRSRHVRWFLPNTGYSCNISLLAIGQLYHSFRFELLLGRVGRDCHNLCV